MSAATRQRWQRRRRRQGRKAFTIYLDDDFRAEMVASGLMTPEEVGNPHLFAERLGNLLETLLFP